MYQDAMPLANQHYIKTPPQELAKFSAILAIAFDRQPTKDRVT